MVDHSKTGEENVRFLDRHCIPLETRLAQTSYQFRSRARVMDFYVYAIQNLETPVFP